MLNLLFSLLPSYKLDMPSNDDEHLVNTQRRRCWRRKKTLVEIRHKSVISPNSPTLSTPLKTLSLASSFHNIIFFHPLFCLFDIESRGRRGVVVVRGAIMCLCVFVSDDGCAFYCSLAALLLPLFTLSRFFLTLADVLKQNEKWIYGVHSRWHFRNIHYRLKLRICFRKLIANISFHSLELSSLSWIHYPIDHITTDESKVNCAVFPNSSWMGWVWGESEVDCLKSNSCLKVSGV